MPRLAARGKAAIRRDQQERENAAGAVQVRKVESGAAGSKITKTKANPAAPASYREPVKTDSAKQNTIDFQPQGRTTAQDRAVDLLLNVGKPERQEWALGVKPQQPVRDQKQSQFPSHTALGLKTSGREMTDALMKPVSGAERTDSFIKSTNPLEKAMTAGDAAFNLLGTRAKEQVAAAEQAAAQEQDLEIAARQAEQAGDWERVQQIRKEQIAGALTQNQVSILDLLLNAADTSSENDTSKILRDQKATAQETLLQGLTPGQQTLAGIGVQGADMLGSYAMSALTGVPLSLYNAVTGGAAVGQEALDKGVSAEQALPLAIGSGAISYGIEKAGGVAGDWGQKLLQKAAGTKAGQAVLSQVPQKVVEFLGSISKNKAAQILGTGLEEGLENFTEYDLQRMWQNLILDEETPFDIRQAMAEAGAGVLFGSIVAGTNAAAEALPGAVGRLANAWQDAKTDRIYQKYGPQNMEDIGFREIKPGDRLDAGKAFPEFPEIRKTVPESVDMLLNVGNEQKAETGISQNGETRKDGTAQRSAAERLAGQLVTGAAKKGAYSLEKVPEIRTGMNETERFRALRDVEFPLAEAKPERLEGVDVEALETAIKSQARQYIRPLAEKLGIFKDYRNDNVDLEFVYTKGGFDESIHKQSLRTKRFDDFARMFSVFDELVQSAVPIESHGDKYAGTVREVSDLARTAVLVSAFQDGDRIVPVQFEIKEFNNQPNKLYISVTLRDIKTGTRVEGDTLSSESSKKSPIQVPTYSLAQLFQNVNPEDIDFLKYVPDQFLSRAQREGKQRGLAAEQQKIANIPPKGPGSGNGDSIDLLLNIGKDEGGQVNVPRSIEDLLTVGPSKEAARQQRRAEQLAELERAEQARNPGPQDPGETISSRPQTEEQAAEVESLLNGEAEAEVIDQGLSKAVQNAQNRFYNTLRKEMPLPATKEGRAEVRKALERMTRELAETGTVYQETADQVFDTLYDNLRILNTDRYDQYQSVKKELRQSRMFLSDTDRADIPDFEAFRRTNVGNFTVTRDPSAVPVDVKYQELSRSHPELFPADITHPADQLQKMAEVSKSIAKQEIDVETYYGEDAAAFREYTREQFDEALDQMAEEISKIPTDRMLGDEPAPDAGVAAGQDYADYADFLSAIDKGLVDDPSQADILREAYRKAQEILPEVYSETDLTDQEKELVKALRKGTTSEDFVREQLGDAESAERVIRTAEGQRRLDEAMKPIKEYNDARIQRLIEDARMATVNTDMWKDKATGVQYQRETMERNLRDIIPNKAEAEAVIDQYFTPVHENEARRNRFLNEYRDRVKKLGLTKKESKWVQLIGEGVKDIQNLPLDMDPVKIARAVAEFRDRIYPELYNQVADALMLNGYTPPGRLQNYFPHFKDPDDPLTNLLRIVGIEVDMRELPTSIAGITETFEPGKSFFANLLHRDGVKTDYDALEGFDRYIEGASNLIYHTEDIQRLRILEQVIREKYDKSGKKSMLDELTGEPLQNDLYKDWETDKLFGKDMSRLSRFITELHSYTNSLAGKKNIADRNWEHGLGRGMYSVSKALEGRVAANMVALNPGSWINNLIPLTQGGAEVSTRNFLKAMEQTMRNYTRDDGFVGRSTFLTNREGSRAVSRTGVQKAVDALSSPMQMVDMFTANILTRGRYLDNLEAGMNEAAAMREADKWAAGVMADRSKGALPTLFEKKNPFIKLFTMFQVETNNQLSYLFKDLPREAKKKGVKWAAATLLEMGVASWLYNELYEKLTGRRPALDGIGIATDFAEDLQNENLSFSGAMKNMGENVLEQLPFTTALNLMGIEGGGRYPVASAVPDASKIVSAASGWMEGSVAPNAAMERIGKELAKPAFYLIPPAGGGQAKKIIEGMDALLNGGVYSTNSKGGEELLYSVDNDPLTAAQTLLFGRGSTENARQYYRDFHRIEPESQAQKQEAEARSLPRILKYSYGEEEDKVTGSLLLTKEEQKAYQTDFSALLPDGMEGLSKDMQDKIYTYAEQVARDKALAGRGIDGYEPEGWVQKAHEAAQQGVGVDQYLQLREEFSGMEPTKDRDGKTTETAISKKRETLLADSELTPEQKAAVDRILIDSGENAKTGDYSSENAFRRSQLTETERARYDAAAKLFGGMEVERYENLVKMVKEDKRGEETSLQKKQRDLQALLDEGMSRREAYAFYSLATVSNPQSVDWTDREGACYAGLSDNAKEKYQEVSQYFVKLPVSDFSYIQDVLSGVEGIRDGNGRTISGSVKRNKIRVLMDMGMNEQEALIYYNITG